MTFITIKNLIILFYENNRTKKKGESAPSFTRLLVTVHPLLQ